MKKLCSTILAFAMLFSLCITPALAASTTATAFRMEMMEGTVTVTNATGREVTVREGSRLYNGYEIATKDGYAWLSLDNDKILKLDYNTIVTLKKSGSDLEIMLESGSVFFDVQKPLESDESLTIRTSTMLTGVRGTIGVATAAYVPVPDSNKQIQNSTITLFEGKLEVVSKGETATDPTTVTLLEVGEKLIVSQEDVGDDGVATETTVVNLSATEGLTENPFVAVEVAKDSTLLERIEEAQPESDIGSVVEVAEELLAEKEEETSASMDEADSSVSDTVEEVTTEDTSSSDEVVSTGGSSSSGGSSSGGSTTSTVTLTYVYNIDAYTVATFYVSEQTVGDVIELPTLIPYTASGSTGCWYCYQYDDNGTYTCAAVQADTPVLSSDMTLTWVAITN